MYEHDTKVCSRKVFGKIQSQSRNSSLIEMSNNYVPVEDIIKSCSPLTYEKLLNVQQNLKFDTRKYLEDNFTNLLTLAKGAEKAAIFKNKGKCHKTEDEDSDSDEEDDQSDLHAETGDHSSFTPMFTPRHCFTTKKGQIFGLENDINYDDLQNFPEVPLTLDNVIEYLPMADILIQFDLDKKIASDDLVERR